MTTTPPDDFRCDRCGQDNETGAAYCANCGAALTRADNSESAAGRSGGAAPLAYARREVGGGRKIYRWVWAIPVLLAAGLYAPALTYELVWDDQIVRDRQMIAFKTLNDVFFPPRGIPEWATMYYRPMVTITYLIDQYLFGRGDSVGPHGSVVVFHLICTFFVWLLARRVLCRFAYMEWGALAAAVVFAVHPIHTESVCWVTGRSDTVATMFLLPSIVAALAYREAGTRSAAGMALLAATLLYSCAILSKEVALCGLILVPALFIFVPRQPSSSGFAPRRMGRGLLLFGAYAAATAGYFVLRSMWTKSAGAPLEMGFGDLVGRAVQAVGYYCCMAVVPFPQSTFPHFLSWTTSAVAVAVMLAVLLLSIWLYMRGSSFLFIATGWFLLAIAPSLAIAVRRISETPVAERYLYLPSVAIALLLGGMVAAASAHRFLRRPAALAVVLICGTYAFGTWQRGKVWSTNIALWTDAVAKAPDKGLPIFSLAGAYMKKGENIKALRLFRESLPLYAADNDVEGVGLAHNSIGAMLMATGRREEALNEFEESIKVRPGYATPYFNIGKILLDRATDQIRRRKKIHPQRLLDVREKLITSLKLNPRYVRALLVLAECDQFLAVAYASQRNINAASHYLERAILELQTLLKIDPNGAFANPAQAKLQQLLAARQRLPRATPTSQPASAPTGVHQHEKK